MWARVFRDSPLFRWLSGNTGRYELPLSMTSVRAGDRLLYVGDGDMQFLSRLAARTGLSGNVHALVTDEAAAARARSAAEQQGALVEVAATALDGRLPFEPSAFDLAIVDATLQSPPAVDYGELRRVLRVGGRVVAVGGGAAGGVMRKPTAPMGLGERLREAMTVAFPSARVLAERDGWVFVEGLKGRGKGDQVTG